MRRFGIAAAMAALCVGVAAGDVFLNEVYASHAGTDTQEFVELIGTPSMSLNDYWVLVVEGDGAASGTLDRGYQLTSQSIPGDGYFVLGDTATPNTDFLMGTDNQLENGSETVYLVEADAVGAAAISARIGTDSDVNDDGIIFGAGGELSAGVTIVDIIAMVDSGFGTTDIVYDSAPVRGPDGTFFPAGVYRPSDHPNDWANTFLNFDNTTIGSSDPTRPTPGGMNVPEPASLALLALGALALRRR